MIRRHLFYFAFLVLFTLPASVSFYMPQVFAHCEIPCGIYDDEARFREISEDIRTIEKGMNQINQLAGEPGQNVNQLVRWVSNKDHHADRIKKTVAEYFLSQRVKVPAPEDAAAYDRYILQLRLLHEMTVNAMKAKQTSDLQYVEALRRGLQEFKTVYWEEHGHAHESVSSENS